MRPAAARIALLLFASGSCALIYQTAWLRMLREVFGASTASSAAVLAIFMGGLGFGGLILGRRADREPSPLGFYARLEIGVALAAALSPFLMELVQKIYLGLGGSASLGLAGGTAVRLLLATLVLGLPTFLMGGTLPAAVRAAGRSSDAGRRAVGLLYAVNTLGAVLGTLLTTFFALEALGIRKTIWEAALLNLLVAVIARRMARSMPPVEPEVPSVEEGGRGAGWIVPVAAGLVGFVFLLMELVWYRMLAPLLGGSSYTFGLILAMALLGIGLGGLLYAAGGKDQRPTLTAFAATCALEAVFLGLPFALGDRVAVLAALLRPLVGAGFLPLALGWSLVTALVVLPAAVVSGYQFPLLIGLLGSGRERVGSQVGVTYAANTVGGILGSVAGGFGLMPLLTATGLWRLSTQLLVVLAGVSLLAGLRQGAARRTVAVPLLLAAGGLLLVAAPGPTSFWRHSPIGAGRVETDWQGPNDVRAFQALRRQSILWEADGVESSVALDAGQELSFIVSGKADGSARADAPTQVMGGLVGALLHPDPRRALVIGLGTGSTAGWLAAVPSIERVDTVELEPAIVQIAEAFAPVNHDALRDPKVRLILGDGREVLLTTDERYDIIFSEPSNPYRAGIASLFTEDFYRAARERLRPGGLFLQWLQGYELDARAVGIAYATLGAVFPSVETWEVNSGDLLLVASDRPPVHDVARVRARAAVEPWRSALAWTWGVEGAEGFYAGYLASGAFAREVATQGRRWVNTDDRPILEFGFARNLGRSGLFKPSELSALAAARGQARPESGGLAALDWRRAEELRSVRSAFWRQKVPDPRAGLDPAAAARIRARQAYGQAELGPACAAWVAQPEAPVHPLDRLLIAECLAAGGHPRAPELAERLRRERPVEAGIALGIWHWAGDRDDEAARHLAAAFREARVRPWTFAPILERGLKLAVRLGNNAPGRAFLLQEALAEPFAVRLADYARLRARVALAYGTGRADLCAAALTTFEPHVPWEDSLLRQRAWCYAQTGHPLRERALEDLQEFLEDAPPKLPGVAPGAAP